MIADVVIIGVYLIGCFLSNWMMKIEHECEEAEITKGDVAIALCLSVLSWLAFLIILCKSWVDKINESGYWAKPVKEKSKAE